MVGVTENLLIIEDSIGDARLVKEILKDTEYGNYETTFVHNLDDLTVYNQSNFQAILLDLHLSDRQPMETFKLVNSQFPSIPIIILTGMRDDNLAAQIVRAGAQDYLIKGTIDSDMLQRSLKYSVYRKRTERRIENQKRTSRMLKTRANILQMEATRLEELNKAKDVFLSIASHQLRTPATAVKQYIGMVLQGYAGEIDENQKKFLETAYRSNERQLKIVDDLLQVSRLDGGHVTLHKKPANIVDFVEHIIADFKDTTVSRSQKLSIDCANHEITANIDADNLRMALDNLIDNASRYSGEGTDITVQIEKDKNWVYIRIIDTGIGISDEDQQKLFRKFARIDDSFAIAPNGSGLGLYWAREIVKLHMGDLTLKSKKGIGSTFCITLPDEA